MSVDVLNETDIEVDEIELMACARYVMEQLRVHPQADLCLTLVDETAMESLHVKWMDLPGPTDVMSFPMDELRPGRPDEEPAEGVLGDIVPVSYTHLDVYKRQASDRERSRCRASGVAKRLVRLGVPPR